MAMLTVTVCLQRFGCLTTRHSRQWTASPWTKPSRYLNCQHCTQSGMLCKSAGIGMYACVARLLAQPWRLCCCLSRLLGELPFLEEYTTTSRHICAQTVSLISGSFAEDGGVYYVVGTAYVNPEEREPGKGRILVLQVHSIPRVA